ncbi:MAG TPA: hypothetical protein VF097_10050 [Actinomycetota bacterium]
MEIELELKLSSLGALLVGFATGLALGFLVGSGGGRKTADRLRSIRGEAEAALP